MFTTLKHFQARLRAFFGGGDLDRDFDEELESHLMMLTEDNVRRGMSPVEARRAARLRLGGAQSLRQRHRDVRGLPVVDAFVQDVRFAFRLIARDRWVSGAAIVALALGIGANTVGFTIVNAAFLRGLPFEDADALYTLSWQNRAARRSNVSLTELQDWRAHSQSFQALAGVRVVEMNISDDRALPDQTRGAWVTANLFDVLRQPPSLGRNFVLDDERPGADPVAIIGSRLWRNRYGSDPQILGKTIRINGRPATIVGVMPDGVELPNRAGVWAPLIPTTVEQRREARLLLVFGRTRDDVGRPEAQAELSSIGLRLMAAYPDETKDLVGARVETLTERFVGGAGRRMFIAMMGAVIFVLLIACANVANLLLSRSAHRAREIAIRIAAGATRGRIVRQLLVESLVLSVIGGTLGLVLAIAGVRAFDAAMQNGGLPYWITFTLDYVVFAYVAGICALTAMLFGLAPALHVSKTNSNEVLKDGGRGGTAVRAHKFSTTLVVAELALTMVLLVGAGLMVRSLMALYVADLGIAIDRLMTMRVELPETKYANADARRAFFDRLEPRLAAIPGVEAAAVTTGVPPLDGGERLLETDRTAGGSGARPVFVGTVTITPRFFDAVGVGVVRGRNFGDTDGAPGSETVIINERLAERFFPGENPLGRQLRFTQRDSAPGQPPDVWRTIVGISPLIKHGSPDEAYVNSVVYIPYRQESPASASLLVRSALPPASVMDAVRREVQAIDPDQPVVSMQTVAQLLEGDRWWYRTFGSAFGSFALIALVLSSVGLYALMAYAVTQRTQEIGVRMAVGAQRWQVCWLILKRGLMQLGTGLLLGAAGAFVISDVLSGLLVEISPTDPLTFAIISFVLIIVSITACLLPARTATRIDPIVTLRAE